MKKENSTILICSLHIIFFQGILQIESIALLYLELFEGNLKNVCQKAIKRNSSSSCSTSIVPMVCYHVIKMN